MKSSKPYRYIQKNADEIFITTSLAHLCINDTTDNLSEQELVVLAALKRANTGLADASNEEIKSYLLGLDDDQLQGLVSSVKGIVHEMEFIYMENEDGDSLYVSMFENTNHPDTDVIFFDQVTGHTWEAQLKATNNTSYVQEWIDEHPNGEILVTTEIAEKMDIPTSGLSNEQLTASVTDLVDEMIVYGGDVDMWDYFPALSLLSISLVIVELWKRYRNGEITLQTFKQLTALATGLKVGKIATITLLLSTPVVGQITGALLIANLLLSAKL